MTSECTVALLESALSGSMSAEREEWLYRHLEECEACSVALEEMAGGAAWCQEAAALLIGDELDDAVPARDEWSGVDFTVEHLEPADEPNVLGRLGGYDVLEIIGRGGMGVVLKGFDRELKRCVAIKVLAPHLAQSSLARKRFAREAQAAAAVVHPNVLAIHQVQSNGRLPFLVMPLLAGESLAQRLIAQGRLELKETLRIGIQAAAGLAAAHEQGLVHRDVKPANILLEKGVERAVLTDFGLARAADDVSMTRWGIIAGTPQYMSPEQARGEPVDGRSDLFSLGCVLYEMATGVSPFRADSTMATLRRLIDDPPPAMASLNPELPPWFIGIVERLLEKEPSQRFSSAKEVSELLEGCLAHLQQPTSVPLPPALPQPAARRVSRLCNNLWKGAMAMIGTLTVALLGMFVMQSTAPPDIAGQWSGEEWGQIVLTQTAPGRYTGTYSQTLGKEPGKIELKWSRIERRFNGKWSQGEDRFGELSLRLADREIRGALTVDPKSKIDPATPRLADFMWTRPGNTSDSAKAAPPAAQTQKPDEFPLRFGGAIKGTHRFHPNFRVRTIACSPDGNLIAVGNGEPLTLRSTNGRALLAGKWRPMVDVFDTESRLTASLKLTTSEEDGLLAEASDLWYTHHGPERVPYFEVKALTFSPDGSLVAVGTSVGQVKLFNAHTGELVRSLDDRDGKQADKKTTEKLMSLTRAMGSVASLGFSPDGSLLAMAGGSFDDNPLVAKPWSIVPPSAKLATGRGRLKVWDVATWTLKHDLVGHSCANGIAFSPDGNFLASAGSWLNENEGGKGVTVEGEGAIIWSAWTGAKLRVINRPASCGTEAVAFSPDSRLIAIGSRNYYQGRATGNPNLCVAEVLSPVTLWQQGADIAGETVAFSPDGKNLLVSCGGLSIKFLDTPTGELTRQLRGPDIYQRGYWMHLAIAVQARTLVISATDDEKREPGFLTVWKMQGREETDESPSAPRPATAAIIPQRLHHFPTDDAVGTIACSPDGKLIAIGNGSPASTTPPDTEPVLLPRDWKPSAAILDAQTGKTLVSLKLTRADEDAALSAAGRVPNFQVEALAFSSDGRVLAVGTSLGQVKLFNIRTGELTETLDDQQARLAAKGTPEALKSLTRAMGSVRSLAFSPDGSLLAVGGHSFDEAPIGPVPDAKSTTERAADAIVSPAHGQVKVWQVKTGTIKPGLGGSGSGNAVAFSPDGNLLAGAGTWYVAGELGSGAMIWNVRTGEKVRNIKTHNCGFTRCVAFAPDSKSVAFCTFFHGDGGTSVTWLNLADALSGNQMYGNCGHRAYVAAFWPEGNNVAVLSDEQSILFFNTETWAVKHEIGPPDAPKGGRWHAFALAPQVYMLAIGGIDAKKQNFVEVWGTRTGPSQSQ